MRLPPELRRMIYRMVYPEKHMRFDWANTYPGHPLMYRLHYYGTTPPLTVSKQIYRESRAVFLGATKFRLNSIRILRRFLDRLGPEGRKMLTALEIKYSAHGAVNTFKLLAQCTALRSLAIIVRVEAAPYVKQPDRLMKRSGLKQLLAIRGIQELDLRDIHMKYVRKFGLEVDFNKTMAAKFNTDKENFIQALQVLKLPRS